MFVYCLYISGSMSGDEIHNANDDCAICKAWSKKQAIKKFKRMYCDFEESDVFRAKYNKLEFDEECDCVKKKYIIISIVVVVISVAVLCALTNMFTRGVITGKLYRVDNVYEEIWNMVNSEKNGAQTILTSSTEGAEVIYGLGQFEQVCIPVNDEYVVCLGFNQNKFSQYELTVWLFEKNDDRDTPLYVYNYHTNTLYGNQEESYLIDNFTSLYYSWVGSEGKFNPDSQGDYTFELTEYPLNHE